MHTFLLKVIHENIYVRWRAYQTHGTAFSLKIVFAVEHKFVQVKIRAKKVIVTFLPVCLCNGSFTDFITSTFEILAYKDLTKGGTK